METQLSWDTDLLEGLNKSLQVVPLPFREKAITAIVAGSEEAAVERGSEVVEKADLHTSVNKNVPRNMIGFCLKGLRKQGIVFENKGVDE